MDINNPQFSSMLPERVNAQTLELCERQLQEPFWKASLRLLGSLYLGWRYRIRPLGRGFRWSGWQDPRWEIAPGVLKVGHFVRIGPGAHIIYPTVIGDVCMLAEDVHIIGNDHGIDQVGVPMRIARPRQDARDSVTVLESDVWIGQRAMLFAGLKIGRGSVVAAGSVVTRDVPAYSIVAGVPARIVRKRFSEAEEAEYSQRLYG